MCAYHEVRSGNFSENLRDVLKKFVKFKGKHLCRSHFIKKEAPTQVFPMNFAKFLRTPFFWRTPLVVASDHCRMLESSYINENIPK